MCDNNRFLYEYIGESINHNSQIWESNPSTYAYMNRPQASDIKFSNAFMFTTMVKVAVFNGVYITFFRD